MGEYVLKDTQNEHKPVFYNVDGILNERVTFHIQRYRDGAHAH